MLPSFKVRLAERRLKVLIPELAKNSASFKPPYSFKPSVRESPIKRVELKSMGAEESEEVFLAAEVSSAGRGEEVLSLGTAVKESCVSESAACSDGRPAVGTSVEVSCLLSSSDSFERAGELPPEDGNSDPPFSEMGKSIGGVSDSVNSSC